METGRRHLLLSLGTAASLALAGCGVPRAEPSSGTLTVRVNNQSGQSQPVSVTVTDPDGRVVEEDSGEVPADVSRAFESAGHDAESYTIRVRGGGWATSSWWRPATCPEYVFTTTLDAADGTPSVTAGANCASTE